MGNTPSNEGSNFDRDGFIEEQKKIIMEQNEQIQKLAELAQEKKVKNKINPYVVAIGAGFTISITLNPIANASENPFEIRGLGTGYMLADGHEGKCGEGKCGEGKCGSKKS